MNQGCIVALSAVALGAGCSRSQREVPSAAPQESAAAPAPAATVAGLRVASPITADALIATPVCLGFSADGRAAYLLISDRDMSTPTWSVQVAAMGDAADPGIKAIAEVRDEDKARAAFAPVVDRVNRLIADRRLVACTAAARSSEGRLRASAGGHEVDLDLRDDALVIASGGKVRDTRPQLDADSLTLAGAYSAPPLPGVAVVVEAAAEGGIAGQHTTWYDARPARSTTRLGPIDFRMTALDVEGPLFVASRETVVRGWTERYETEHAVLVLRAGPLRFEAPLGDTLSSLTLRSAGVTTAAGIAVGDNVEALRAALPDATCEKDMDGGLCTSASDPEIAYEIASDLRDDEDGRFPIARYDGKLGINGIRWTPRAPLTVLNLRAAAAQAPAPSKMDTARAWLSALLSGSPIKVSEAKPLSYVIESSHRSCRKLTVGRASTADQAQEVARCLVETWRRLDDGEPVAASDWGQRDSVGVEGELEGEAQQRAVAAIGPDSTLIQAKYMGGAWMMEVYVGFGVDGAVETIVMIETPLEEYE